MTLPCHKLWYLATACVACLHSHSVAFLWHHHSTAKGMKSSLPLWNKVLRCPEKETRKGLSTQHKDAELHTSTTILNGGGRTDNERLQKLRSFPLFMGEKVAAAFDDAYTSIFLSNDSGCDEKLSRMEKERLVILGTGWGSAAFLKSIDTSRFDVTVVSPRNFFLFTPLLSGATVGSVEYRSITEPVRRLNRNVKYIEALASMIDPKTKKISCESVNCEGLCELDGFDVEYDKLVLAVGAQTSTFGVPGVEEHCYFLKQIEDARSIRAGIVDCFERATFPHLSDKERENLLTFVVIGAGPSGVEFASELKDFVEEEGPKYYKEVLKHVRIKVISDSYTVLGPFDHALQQAAIEELNRKAIVRHPELASVLPPEKQFIELLLGLRVTRVEEGAIHLDGGEIVNYGLAVWAAGNGPLPITLGVIDSLGAEQTTLQKTARGRVVVDRWLRALGGNGDVFAIGDCAFSAEAPVPATGQVASQQGEFVGRLLARAKVDEIDDVTGELLPPIKKMSKKEGRAHQTMEEGVAELSTGRTKYSAPFQFWDMGILAYTGEGTALAQVQMCPDDPLCRVKGTGPVGFWVWRTIYLAKQVSLRNKLLVATDWVKKIFFGRDITRI